MKVKYIYKYKPIFFLITLWMMLAMNYGYFKPSREIEHLIIWGVSIPLSIIAGIPMGPEPSRLTDSKDGGKDGKKN